MMSKLVQGKKRLPESIKPYLKQYYGLLDKKLYSKGLKEIPMSRVPNFIIIGLAKSATGWLTTLLKKQEDFHYGSNFLREGGEMNYFSKYFHYPLSLYLNQFKGGEDKFRFEKSPGYATMPFWKIQLMKKLFPNTKVILILREPVERAWSHAKWNAPKANGTTDLDQIAPEKFYRLFDVISAQFNYSMIVQNWESIFGNNLSVFNYQELKENPDKRLTSISRFIGYDKGLSNLKPDKKKNATPTYKMPDDFRKYLEDKNEENINFFHNFFKTTSP